MSCPYDPAGPTGPDLPLPHHKKAAGPSATVRVVAALGVGLAVGLAVSSLFRRPALRHALLSYVCGGVVIAATVNLVAGLGTSPGAAHSPRSGPPCGPAT